MKNLFTAFLAALAICFTGCDSTPRGSGPSEAAARFFQEVGTGHFQEAYEDASFSFQAQTSPKHFEATAKDLGLTAGAMTCHWIQEETKGRDAKLTGEVRGPDGASVPLVVTLIEERGAWRVYSLRNSNGSGKEVDRFTVLGKGPAFSSLAAREMPTPKELEALVRESLMLFNSAIAERNFANFYSKVSGAWQNQLTEGQLKRAFQPFIDSNVDIHEIQDLQPIFDTPPKIDLDGILLLSGHYDTKPYRTTFILRFTYEMPYWKLYGVEVQIQG